MRLQVFFPSCAGYSAAACMLALLLSAPHSQAQDLVLSQISPTSGEPGTLVTITGEKFGALQGKSSVKFGSAVADVRLWSDDKIVAVAPSAATPGQLDVLLTIFDVKEEHPGKFTISHLSPDQGPAGTPVIMTGKGFGNTQGTGAVYFGATEAKNVLRWSDEQVVVAAPDSVAAGSAPLNVVIKLKKLIKKDKTVYTLVVSYPQGTFALTPAEASDQAVAKPVAANAAKPAQPVAANKTQPLVAKPAAAPAEPPKADIAPLSGTPGTTVKITPPAGTPFPKTQGNDAVYFLDKKATVADGKWSDTEIDAEAPDCNPAGAVPVTVTIKDGNGTPIFTAGPFVESPKPAARLNRSRGFAGTAVKITGSGFGASAGSVTFGGATATVLPGGWSDGEIDAVVPNLKSGLPVDADVEVLDATKKTVASAGRFTVTPPYAIVTPAMGVAGTTVTIAGAGVPATQGTDKVLLGGVPVTAKFSDQGITFTAPDLVTEKESEATKRAKDAAAQHTGKPTDAEKLAIKNAQTENDMLMVAVVDANNQPVVAPSHFTETPPQWSDKDEKPFSIKFVGGYEQGFQSAQSGTSNAFVAVYGRSLFREDTLGPFFHIRLQTAPQASDTNGVVSVLTNPSSAITTQSLQNVGSAVDLDLGLERQFKHKFFHGQTSLAFIGGGGFVTPLQANSINATYTMPAYGTVECAELQSRFQQAGVLKSSIYAGIQPTTSTTTPATTSCFTNVTTGTPVSITTLEYAAPDQPNFFPKYFGGLRIVNRFPGTSGLKICNEGNPCERGYVDFTLGQNASISGGTLKHLVVNIDSIYPMPIPALNFLYFFGSASERLHNLPANQSPLVLQVPSPAPTPGPNPANLVVPMKQPDRDFYRIGVGVSLNQIFTALKPKAATTP